MDDYPIIPRPSQLVTNPLGPLPTLITAAGERAKKRFEEFFTAEIRNANTRRAYARAVRDFCWWCEGHGLRLEDLNPVIVAGYVEHLGEQGRKLSEPTVKQHLAALRMLGDYLVLGHVLETNPASSVRGPKYVIKKGKTPVLTAEEARQLFDKIPTGTVAGLRDRALIGVMVFSFARVGAVIKMDVADVFVNGRRCFFRLHEKGGKYHEVPAHHKAIEFMDAYVDRAGIAGDKKGPLFRTLDRHRRLTAERVHPNDVLRMIKRYARRAGLSEEICCHTFRATGITTYLQNGGTVEKAAQIAAHESTRTTQLYNRTADEVSLDEIERIII
jgi:integrase/recombinase XerD